MHLMLGEPIRSPHDKKDTKVIEFNPVLPGLVQVIMANGEMIELEGVTDGEEFWSE